MSKLRSIVIHVLIVALFLLLGVAQYQFQSGKVRASEAVVLKLRADLSTANAKAEAESRAKEQALNNEAALIADMKHEADLRSQVRITARDAGLRDGSLRVLDRFSCGPGIPGELPSVAGAASGPDTGVSRGFVAEDARAALAVTDEGDERTRLLNQAIRLLKAERE